MIAFRLTVLFTVSALAGCTQCKDAGCIYEAPRFQVRGLSDALEVDGSVEWEDLAASFSCSGDGECETFDNDDSNWSVALEDGTLTIRSIASVSSPESEFVLIATVDGEAREVSTVPAVMTWEPFGEGCQECKRIREELTLP